MRPMTVALALALGLAACADDAPARDDADTRATAPDAPDAPDATTTSADDTATDSDTSGDEPVLEAAAGVPGHLVAVRVAVADPERTSVAIGPHTVRLHRGVGVLTARAEDVPGVVVRPLDASDLTITGERVVAAGETLTIPAGARVVLGAGARLVVHGTLVAEGTAAAPILFTPDDAAAPWAAIDVRAGGRAELAHTWLVGGGADADRFAGHSGSDPFIAAVSAVVELRGGGIVDGPGKAFFTDAAQVLLEDVVIARCDTGGEHVGSTTTMRRLHVIEIPDADGRFDDDDNDGLYLRLGTHELEDVVVSLGEDDGIDHNGADLNLRGAWIQGVRHEGVATSDGGVAHLEDLVVRDAGQGVEAGYGSPEVQLVRAWITGCDVGLRWGDEYDWAIDGSLDVTQSVVLFNTTNVKTDDPQAGEAPAGHVDITCSAVDSPAWDAVGGNVAGAPPARGLCPPELTACDLTPGPTTCP